MMAKAMIAMEYAFAFPDDFDMAAIRRRVADKGRLFDTYPGLLRKAFLARDRRADSQAEPAEAGNSYATFYLWSSAKAAAIAAQQASLDALRGRPGFHSAILSLDSANWSILCFSLWATATSAEALANGCNARYEVLHLSTPAQGIPMAEERLQTAG